MKRVLSVIMIFILSLGLLSGCSSKTDNKSVKNIKIGVTLYDQYDVFLSALITEFNEYASDLSAKTGVTINIETYNAATSQSTQNSQVRSMIDAGCDVICVNLVDRTDTSTIIDLAAEYNVPIIFFNRQLVEEDLYRGDSLYYVGAEASSSGTMQGELAADYLQLNPEADKNNDGLIQYVVLEGEVGHQDAILRTESCTQAIEDKGFALDKVGFAVANWNRDQAKTKTLQLIDQGAEIELVLANNDAMALGAIDAYKASGISQEQWPAVFGIDGVMEGLEAVKNQEMISTVYNDKEGQALAMLELAYYLSTGTKMEHFELDRGKYIVLPYTKVTLENLSDFK